VKNCLEQYVCHSHLANREYLPHNLTRAGGSGQAQHRVYADLWEEGVRQDSLVAFLSGGGFTERALASILQDPA